MLEDEQRTMALLTTAYQQPFEPYLLGRAEAAHLGGRIQHESMDLFRACVQVVKEHWKDRPTVIMNH